MKLRTFLTTALAAAALAVTTHGFAQSTAAYKPEYRMSLVLGTAFPWGKSGEIWANLVRERTQGRINIKLYPGVSLIQGDQTREFSALRQGVIDLAVGSTINWSPQVRQLNLFSMPFLMPDFAAIDALTTGEVGAQLFKDIERAGAVPLAWGENGYREISNSKQAIKTPADLKGLKIRVVGSPLFLDTFSALGSNPTPLAFSEVYQALQTGVVDGAENPWSNIYSKKFHEVQKYIVDSNHGVLIIGRTVAETFNRLTYFERAAETYIRALQTGKALRILPEAIAEKTAQEWETYPGFADAHLREIKALLDEDGSTYAS